ncbi:hypothetical protein SUGI_1204990 [Cryptomeria japonica]|nr:hypothetical protein SUGI_1204990 [Cryptomeria japonica]
MCEVIFVIRIWRKEYLIVFHTKPGKRHIQDIEGVYGNIVLFYKWYDKMAFELLVSSCLQAFAFTSDLRVEFPRQTLFQDQRGHMNPFS